MANFADFRLQFANNRLVRSISNWIAAQQLLIYWTDNIWLIAHLGWLRRFLPSGATIGLPRYIAPSET